MLGSQEYITPSTPGRSLSVACPINFQFDELKRELNQFTDLFDDWLTVKKRQLLAEREKNSFNLAEDNEIADKLRSQSEYYAKHKIEVADTLEKERREVKEAQVTNDELKKQKTLLEAKKASLLLTVQELTNRLNYETEILRQKQKQKELKIAKNQPELFLFRQKLGLEITPAKKNLMKFVFTQIDKEDWSRECYFYLDVSSSDYVIVNCNPLLDSLQSLNTILNTDRDFYEFLKLIRRDFVNYFKTKITE